MSQAEAASGGLDTEAFSAKTLQCKTIPSLFALGEAIDGRTALAWGLANRAVPVDQVEPARQRQPGHRGDQHQHAFQRRCRGMGRLCHTLGLAATLPRRPPVRGIGRRALHLSGDPIAEGGKGRARRGVLGPCQVIAACGSFCRADGHQTPCAEVIGDQEAWQKRHDRRIRLRKY